MRDQKQQEFMEEWKKRLKRAAQWNDDAEINNLTRALESYLYLKNVRPLKDELHAKLNFCNQAISLLPIYRKWFSEMSTFISFIRVAHSFKSKDFKEFVTRKMGNYDRDWETKIQLRV